jgi:hypothetical protein
MSVRCVYAARMRNGIVSASAVGPEPKSEAVCL